MLGAGKGKGGLALAFGLVAGAAVFYGGHIALTAAAKGTGVYNGMIAGPAEWLLGAFKAVCAKGAELVGLSAPGLSPGGEVFVPPEATEGISKSVSWLKEFTGIGGDTFVPPAAEAANSASFANVGAVAANDGLFEVPNYG